MTVTDRLTKLVHLIPTTTNATAKDIAELFIRHIVRLRGIPRDFVSDRDTKFCSIFGRSIIKTLNVELK